MTFLQNNVETATKRPPPKWQQSFLCRVEASLQKWQARFRSNPPDIAMPGKKP
jgi:hypothetical protein